jgi:hypothetical protein
MSAAQENDDITQMFDRSKSPQLGAWDLRGQDVTVTIERVTKGKIIGEGGRTDVGPLIYFKGKQRPLALNRTNFKTIRTIVGSNLAREWIGKRITLYPTTTKLKGETVDCIRVRPQKPSGPDSSFPEVPVDQDMRDRQTAAAGKQEG